ncbi:FAD:protein FMN transferase [Tropicimonas sp. TH_r6]|uniref:FAD:protein FMN transferase n=1 Tax=Tropicimonas sp. TH_r6 TaxID=3082085 RepID=UPI0029542178|nr:FAD:protein FMN transferase [Tropicimonas sp. TH_r6]MDV7143275.1 FAD:protein FMN transferase [Tropicimonas sp. TH_r6]
MRTSLSRRRFLAITASAAATPALAGPRGAHWRGTALGAGASMRLEGIDAARARPVFAAVAAELRRLEAIFSLHETQSSLSRLNRTGRLDHPPAELLEVLSLSGLLHSVTRGAFDPTIQPLWQLRAEAAVRGRTPDATGMEEAQARTGWTALRVDPQQVAFARPGMALTLNGIAQGYITDKIAALLHGRGLRDVLIDMGEIAASGSRADGAAWTAGVARPDGTVVRRVKLTDRALATSAPSGTLLDAQGKVGHILDPQTGASETRHGLVSVSAGRAAIADGLSTACCLLSSEDVHAAIAAFPTARLEALA